MKPKTETEKRRHWFGRRPKFNHPLETDRLTAMVQFLIGRTGRENLQKMVREAEDPYENQNIYDKLYGSFHRECKELSKEYRK